jgi:hypothetical protein
MKLGSLYRMLLKAYPLRFRREYEDAMAQCFRDQLRAASTAGKRFLLCCHTIADLALSVPARHLERGIRRCVVLAGHVLRGHLGIPRGYTEGAMQSVYLARLEAASFGAAEIRAEHLLLGALRQDPVLAAAVLGSDGLEGMLRAIESDQGNPRPRLPRKERDRITLLRKLGSNLALSVDSKRALALAFWLAHGSGAKVGSLHLLSAIHKDTGPAGRILRERALDASRLTRRLLPAPETGVDQPGADHNDTRVCGSDSCNT